MTPLPADRNDADASPLSRRPRASDHVPSPERRFLSAAEFCAATGLSSATFWRRVRDDSIIVWQPGGRRTRVLVPIEALQAVQVPRPKRVLAIASAAGSEPTRRYGPAPRWLQDQFTR